MVTRDVVRALNAGRVALGVGLVLAPRRSAAVWIGDDARRAETAVLARAHGAREIVLGSLAIGLADEPRVGPRVQGALALCDAVDLVVTVAARRALPRSSTAVALVAALGLAVQLGAAQRLIRR